MMKGAAAAGGLWCRHWGVVATRELAADSAVTNPRDDKAAAGPGSPQRGPALSRVVCCWASSSFVPTCRSPCYVNVHLQLNAVTECSRGRRVRQSCCATEHGGSPAQVGL